MIVRPNYHLATVYIGRAHDMFFGEVSVLCPRIQQDNNFNTVYHTSKQEENPKDDDDKEKEEKDAAAAGWWEFPGLRWS